jgi:hypothetical protein
MDLTAANNRKRMQYLRRGSFRDLCSKLIGIEKEGGLLRHEAMN